MESRHYRQVTSLVLGLCLAAGTSWTHQSEAAVVQGAIFPAGIRPTGYKLGLLATACWMGGVWSDAEGAHLANRRARDDQRCRDLVVSIRGRFDQASYEQIRANETYAIEDLLAKIRATEPAATRDQTVALFRDVASAMHEGMLARRAADRVKTDHGADSVEAKLTVDERTAAKALTQHAALERLLATTDPGAADRHVLGLLLALDRMEIGRELPKQLKFYALGYVLMTAFNAPAPTVAALDPTAAPRPGMWLEYLAGIAARAGYPAADSPAINPTIRETLAWTGVGHGFADQLRRQAANLSNTAVPELSRIATSIATRLDTERKTAETMSTVQAQRRE